METGHLRQLCLETSFPFGSISERPRAPVYIRKLQVSRSSAENLRSILAKANSSLKVFELAITQERIVGLAKEYFTEIRPGLFDSHFETDWYG